MPTRVLIVVADRGILRKMRLLSPGFGGEPAAALVICTDTSVKQNSALASFDAGAAAENVALAATSLGLGVGFVRSYPEEPMKRLLHLPPHVRTEIVMTIGYSVKNPSPPPKSVETPVYQNQYGTVDVTAPGIDPAANYGALFEVALYTLMSARTVIDEPSRYGPRRLMDTLERILALREVDADEFLAGVLTELRQRTDMQFSSVVYTDQFKDFLESIIFRFIDEMEKRDRQNTSQVGRDQPY